MHVTFSRVDFSLSAAAAVAIAVIVDIVFVLLSDRVLALRVHL